jgi:hypothetical protein
LDSFGARLHYEFAPGPKIDLNGGDLLEYGANGFQTRAFAVGIFLLERFEPFDELVQLR